MNEYEASFPLINFITLFLIYFASLSPTHHAQSPPTTHTESQSNMPSVHPPHPTSWTLYLNPTFPFLLCACEMSIQRFKDTRSDEWNVLGLLVVMQRWQEVHLRTELQLDVHISLLERAKRGFGLIEQNGVSGYIQDGRGSAWTSCWQRAMSQGKSGEFLSQEGPVVCGGGALSAIRAVH